jgi:hypothetical protein
MIPFQLFYLQTTSLWVIATTSEQTGRFNTEITNFLLAAIHYGVKIWFFHFGLFLLDLLYARE